MKLSFLLKGFVLPVPGILFALFIHIMNIEAAQTVLIDGTKEGKLFEGIGACSAGASTRLLLDYPEPYRSQVLDYLFKPQYGASFQHLKVEIPGDINSTDGCEPSHAHTRAEFENPRPEYYDRGYEWWLMKEAKKRNPEIILDCLEWGVPGWIGNGEFFSQDNADYIVKFIQGAQQYHNLTLDYVGIWNEIRYNVEWIKLLRRTLNANGLSHVKITAPDKHDWDPITNDMLADRELYDAIDAVGTHYISFRYPRGRPFVSETTKKLGKSLWDSEDGCWKPNWEKDARVVLTKMFNSNYISGEMTKTVIWSPVSSYYEILRAANSGVLKALTPWSGYYEPEIGTWVTAHTTQFAEPGWIYLNSGCGYLLDGSYVTLKKPDGSGHYSIIIETADSKLLQTLNFSVTGGLLTSPLHVWRTDSLTHFIKIDDITPENGSFTINLDPGCIYSLTTTTGQHKGAAFGAPPAHFPFPYEDNFESYEPDKLPKYFTDQGGIFEVVGTIGGNGKYLRQVVPQKGIEWQVRNNAVTFPVSIIGDVEWKDYEVSSDVYIEDKGYVCVFGRINGIRGTNANPPQAYWLKIDQEGNWELKVEVMMDSNTLAWGKIPFSANSWHNLKLGFLGNKMTAFVDGRQIWSVTDTTYKNGMAGIGSGFHYARFDNFKIRELKAPEPVQR